MPREFEKPVPAGGLFRVGGWLVEPSLNRLSRDNTTIQLELKVMDVLVCLAERAGKVVPRQEIVDTVWATEFIADNTLTHAITELRNAFGDDARNSSFIETIHRRGYRLIASVEPLVSDEPGISRVARFPVSERAIEDNRNPYPGLAAFTEDDAEYFFGREAEVAQMWRKLTSRRLLAVIGPSGVGKSSFLRAGVIPARPRGWSVLVCEPGEAPFAALARALVPEFSGDDEALEGLVGVGDEVSAVAAVSRWRRRHDGALLVVDQFEELFTLNPPEAQATFAEFLGRLALEADVHVLLTMRDDFLFHSHSFQSLKPILDDLTLLAPPASDALHRTLVEPAKRQGFRFEDSDLPQEMISQVEGERGALPLLAFAMSRLWETRDRENLLLTRQAYQDIGGVGGALARHAEATLEQVGANHLPLVRELFRNLVTAESTRAVREWYELLSVFDVGDVSRAGIKPAPTKKMKAAEKQIVGAGFIPAREAAEKILRDLIDARLLTSCEIHQEDEEPTRRVEIIHESLLANWPRLVRWQTQDADAVQLRDQLRQAARTWEEHDRSDDMLWTGSAYREFASWRERYPGGLTDTEGAFGDAMTALAGRRRRTRRIAVSAGFAVLLAGLAVVGSVWQRSVRETRRAEASELLAVGQLELDSYPSATVAHAIASLELADSTGARRLAQEALWRGPTAFIVNEERSWHVAFTPEGRSLVQAGDGTGHLRLIHANGTSELLEHRHESDRINIQMGLGTDVFYSYGFFGNPSLPFLGLWSLAEGRLLGGIKYEGPVGLVSGAVSADTQRLVYLVFEGTVGNIDVLGFDGTHERLGSPDFGFGEWRHWFRRADLERRTGRWLGAVANGEVQIIEIGDHGLSEPRPLGRQEGPVTDTLFDPLGRFFATAAADGRIRLWDIAGESPPTILEGPLGATLGITGDGSLLDAEVIEDGEITSWVWSLDTNPPRLLRPFDLGQAGIGGYLFNGIGWQVAKAGPDLKIRLWPMGAPADAEPVFLLRGEVIVPWSLSFHPQGHWLASADKTGVALWPLARPYPAVIRRHEKMVYDLVFGPEGRWLASSSMDDTVRLWPLEDDVPLPGRILLEDSGKQMLDLARTPDGEQLLVGTAWSGVRLLSLIGEESQTVPDIGPGVYGATISPDGLLGAGVDGLASSEIRIRVWHIDSGEEAMYLQPEGRYVKGLQFTEDGHLLSSSEVGLRRWNLETGESELLYEGNIQNFAASEDGAQVVVINKSGIEASASRSAVHLNLKTGKTTALETHGTRINTVALDPERKLVITGDSDGVIRVGPITGEEPHLLLGHEHSVFCLAIDPLGRWIASGSQDTTIRLWPMPDLSKPPLHTLPREELISKLKTLTNLRVVRDEDSPTGWKLTHEPFPGWETVPSW